jgi:hypothetical protein
VSRWKHTGSSSLLRAKATIPGAVGGCGSYRDGGRSLGSLGRQLEDRWRGFIVSASQNAEMGCGVGELPALCHTDTVDQGCCVLKKWPFGC